MNHTPKETTILYHDLVALRALLWKLDINQPPNDPSTARTVIWFLNFLDEKINEAINAR